MYSSLQVITIYTLFLTYSDLDDIILRIRERPEPLSLYLFSDDQTAQKKVIGEISFGGSAINNTIFHIVSHFMPFGGVGSSGMGAYHGKVSFDTFSHAKSILKSSGKIDSVAAAYPHKKYFMKIMRKIIGA